MWYCVVSFKFILLLLFTCYWWFHMLNNFINNLNKSNLGSKGNNQTLIHSKSPWVIHRYNQNTLFTYLEYFLQCWVVSVHIKVSVESKNNPPGLDKPSPKWEKFLAEVIVDRLLNCPWLVVGTQWSLHLWVTVWEEAPINLVFDTLIGGKTTLVRYTTRIGIELRMSISLLLVKHVFLT